MSPRLTAPGEKEEFMNTTKQPPRAPVVGEFVRHQGKLLAIEVVTPPPPPPKTEWIFEEEEARCELRLNGEVVKELQTLNDFYGLGTGVKTAIQEMRAYAKGKKLGPASELEVVVVKVVSQIRRYAKPEKENFYDETFHDFDTTDRCRRGLPDPIETVVWSSKKPC